MKVKNRRWLRAGAAATCLVLVTAVASCGSGGAAAEGDGPATIRVSVPHADTINGLVWKVGRQHGLFEDAGVIIEEVIPASGGGTTLQNVVSGNLPFGQVATGAVVNGYNEGAPIHVIGGATQTVYEIGWGVPASSDVHSIEDLATATWGFTNEGSVTEAISYLLPRAAGIPVDSINRASTGGVGEGIALLEAGDVDVTFVPPVVEISQPDLRIVTRGSDHIPSYQTTMLVTSRNYAQDNPATARALLDGYVRSVEWIKNNPEAAGEILATGAEIEVASATELVRRYIEVDHWGVAFNPDALNAAAEGLHYTDGLDSVDWQGLLVDEYLPDGHKGEIPGSG